jgi:hypothetical protein
MLLLGALALAGCNTVGQQNAGVTGSRGATVAFESIDGPPRGVFEKLVQDLNTEAQERRVAVVSREGASAYRVRGYLGAAGSAKQNTVSWIWDVYDADKQRVMRIAGEEKLSGKNKDAWQGVDDAATRRIAHNSMEQLAAFLAASNGGAPVTPVAYDASPEAAGIFRMPRADPEDRTGPVDPEPGVPLPAQRQRAAYQIPSEPPNGTN